MAEARAIKRLVKSLENIKLQVQTFNADTCISEIETSIALLADEWKEYLAVEKSVKGKFDDAHLETVDKIEAVHFDIKKKLIKWKKSHEHNNAQSQNENGMEELLLNQSNFLQEISTINKRESEVRLPRVNIPVFNGLYSEFPSFRDLFEASIHNNLNITKVHKMQYLKGLLKGEAYSLINHLTVTEANYNEAWEKIKLRYDKRKHVVHTLLKQFMEQPSLSQSCNRSLRHLSDVSDEVIRGLKVLGEQAENRDPWLIYIVVNKLDNESQQAWAHETAEIDFPSFNQLLKFLNKRSDALESLNTFKARKPNTSKRVSSMVSQFNKIVCTLCSGDHYLGRCDEFVALSVPKRKHFCVEKRLCFNCLSTTHQSTVCRSRVNCKVCRRRHHFTLHPENDDPASEETTSEKVELATQTNTTESTAMMTLRSSMGSRVQGVLPTVMVGIKDKFGKTHICRALLDSGSQSSFVSENCVQRLRLNRQKANINVTGITTGSVISKGKTVFVIESLYDSTIKIIIDALIINKLPSKIPGSNIDTKVFNSFKNKQLADPDFHKPAPIDVLIGADKFFKVLQGEQEQFESTILQKTIFGWVVSGQSTLSLDEGLATYTAFSVQLDMDLDKTLRQFWEIEEITKINSVSPEETKCEEFFNQTYKRQEDGRYSVQLPFNESSSKLGNSINVASRRFLALERRLSNDAGLRDQYIHQMRQYLQTGHMVEVTETETNPSEQKSFYLPHHAVLKESSDTSKVRVVFDGSSKTTSGISLNDILMVGPTIQPTLWTTLMRFRCNRIAITADIEKMFLQVVVSPEDRNYQRLLWRENADQRLRHYKLTRVTFGLACSSYLAIRTVQQLARDTGDENVLNHVLNNFYVDDFLSGADDVQSAMKIKEKITTVLQQGGFLLRKWRSNVSDLRDDNEEINAAELCNRNSSSISVLGLHWQTADDVLTFKVKPEQEGQVTKRKIISEASRIFDPLGFISPSIILLKILFQKLWLSKLGWDDKLPELYEKEYKGLREEFKSFENIKITRFTNHYGDIQIHGFADASEVAYCAVVYSRYTNERGEININILTAKTKVTPIKRVSLPRLELCAAHLLAKLLTMVRETVAPTAKYYAWTDSAIVLAWLSTYPARWKTFVANRTSKILEQFPRKHWAHVRSADNPADHGSRGLSPHKLLESNQWWHGPEWLKQNEELWATTHSEHELNKSVIERESSKLKIPVLTLHTNLNDDWLSTIFERKSSLKNILRIVAYVKRYVKNLRTRNRNDRNTCELTEREVEEARIQCITWVQGIELREDIKNLLKNKTVSNNSKLLTLAPFIDKTGILRVGGRLFNADCEYDSKHPAILPASHVFTERLIWQTHYENLHAGPTLTNSLIRQKYWLINGRAKIRSILKNCVICVKYAHRTSTQLMGNLPAERITPTHPFTNCGIDFAGPLYFAAKKGRGGTNPVKGYLCVFVCLSIKAVHIEPVSDLTSQAFLAALRRFTARRGVPKKIYTDNGTNFVGAKRILSDACKLIQNINRNYIISEYLSSNAIEWHFIPPSSPHFGGLWESAVKSVKTHLLKSTYNVNLTFEEMATLLCQIENILNSRPLYTTPVDEHYEVLTPAHFLIGTSIGYIPTTEITAADSSLSRWQRIQSRIQTFWKKYYMEYINNLQQRQRWKNTQTNLKVDDVVLIKEDNTPVCKWPLGRIIQTHPGDDKIVRVVTIKTMNSTLQRPIVKLCKLPIG